MSIKETVHIDGWMLILRKRWFWRVLMDGYGIVILLCFGSVTGFISICLLFGLITRRGLFADEVSKAGGFRDWGLLILELLACGLVFVCCTRWTLHFLADFFLPGRQYEGLVETIRLTHIAGNHGGYNAWILTSGGLCWEIFHSDLKHTLEPGDEIRVHYRRGTKAITRMWLRLRHEAKRKKPH